MRMPKLHVTCLLYMIDLEDNMFYTNTQSLAGISSPPRQLGFNIVSITCKSCSPSNHQFVRWSGGVGFQVIDLKAQLRGFNKVEDQLAQKLGRGKARSKLSEAVYIFCIGSNDYMSPFLTNSTQLLASYSTPAYVGMVIGNLTTVIKVTNRMTSIPRFVQSCRFLTALQSFHGYEWETF